MSYDLWTDDEYGEPWLDNPQLIIANPVRRKSTMAKRHRQPAGLRRYWAARRARKNAPRAHVRHSKPHKRRRSYSTRRRQHSSRPRQNAYFAVNKRRKHYTRRRYRSNPSLMGFQLPGLMDVAAVGAGIVVPPIITGYVMGWLPDSMKTSKAAYWTVKAASILVPSLVVRRFVSRRAGNLMLLGGVVSFTLDLIKEFMPGVIPGLGYQPLLGAFVQRPARLAPGQMTRWATNPNMLSPMINSTPDRLSPAARF
jgi:hypothetical protein